MKEEFDEIDQTRSFYLLKFAALVTKSLDGDESSYDINTEDLPHKISIIIVACS